MVIVCNLLSQLENAEEKSINPNAALSLQNSAQQPPDPESTSERSQMAPRPAVIRQSWIEPGNKPNIGLNITTI